MTLTIFLVIILSVLIPFFWMIWDAKKKCLAEQAQVVPAKISTDDIKAAYDKHIGTSKMFDYKEPTIQAANESAVEALFETRPVYKVDRHGEKYELVQTLYISDEQALSLGNPLCTSKDIFRESRRTLERMNRMEFTLHHKELRQLKLVWINKKDRAKGEYEVEARRYYSPYYLVSIAGTMHDVPFKSMDAAEAFLKAQTSTVLSKSKIELWMMPIKGDT